MNKKYIALVVCVIIILILVLILLGNKKQNEGADRSGRTVQQNTLGGTISDALPQNPAKKIPETNPFAPQTNPYKGAYTNPFGN